MAAHGIAGRVLGALGRVCRALSPGSGPGRPSPLVAAARPAS
jgi:hypothetical protein